MHLKCARSKYNAVFFLRSLGAWLRRVGVSGCLRQAGVTRAWLLGPSEELAFVGFLQNCVKELLDVVVFLGANLDEVDFVSLGQLLALLCG